MNLSIALAVTGLGSSLPGFVAPRTAPSMAPNTPALPAVVAAAKALPLPAAAAVAAPAVAAPAAAIPAAVASVAAVKAAPKAATPLAALIGGRAPLTVFDGGVGSISPASPVKESGNTPAPRLASASRNTPRTSPADLPGRTPLEKHAAFFDADGDGVITVFETAGRLRLLGVSRFRAAGLAFLIHLGLARNTSDGWLDKLKLNITVANIHRGIHPGDSGVYDAKGFFVKEQFERMFDSFALSRPGQINEAEFTRMIAANVKRRPGALASQAATAEFTLLLDVAADRTDVVDGKAVRAISRERLVQFYDGTLFYRLTGI